MSERLQAPPLPDWLSAQLPFNRYSVEVEDDLRMHVMEQGSGRPIVMFHGNPTWGYLYRRVAQQLEGEPFRLIMPDLIGLGLSDRAFMSDDYTLVNQARWMSSLLDHLDLTDVIAVVQDWGGPIGLLGLEGSDVSLSGLVVLNTLLGPPKAGFKPTTFHRMFSSRLGGLIPWHRYLGLAQGDRKSISGEVQRSYNFPLSGGQGGSAAAAALVRMVPSSMEHPSVAPLTALASYVEAYDGPSAIVWGSNDPVLGKILRRINRQLPDADVNVTQAGHFIQEEEPEAIANAIRRVESV